MEELSEKDKQKLREAWEQMYAHSAENLLDTAGPHREFLALLNEKLYRAQRLDNAEEQIAELKSQVESAFKEAKKIDDLFRRLDKLTRKG